MPTVNHKLCGRVSYRILPRDGYTTALDMDNAWEKENIVRVHIPQLVGADIGGGRESDGWIRFHKRGVYQLKKAFEEIEAKGLRHLILSFAGSYYPRMIRGSQQTPSEHSFGTALDINAGWNGLGKEPAKVGQRGSVIALVPIFEKWGFRWGGRFKRDDGMHWEIARWIESSNDAVVPKPQTQAQERKVFINDEAIESRLIDGDTWVPLRAGFGLIGYTVQTDQDKTKPDALYLRAWRATPK